MEQPREKQKEKEKEEKEEEEKEEALLWVAFFLETLWSYMFFFVGTPC